jgi:putative multiple sugar transport system ATP-binding protein
VHGKEVRARTVPEAIEGGIAYATEDRKKYGLNLIDDIRRNISAAALGKLSTRGWVNGNEEIKVAEESRRSMNIKAPTVLSIVGKLSAATSRRSCLSKWLFTDPDGAHPRRADPRHRRRREVRDLHDRQQGWSRPGRPCW